MNALKIFVCAGELSGDTLGGQLMAALKQSHSGDVGFCGIGGPEMLAQGLEPVFSYEEIAVMGFGPVIKKLPSLLKRISQTVDAIEKFNPDVVVLIDSQEFSAQVARRIKRRGLQVKVVQYVSPTVWAWRSGRAAKMASFFDLVLCLLPFEPAAMQRLKGPKAVYVGHPLLSVADTVLPSPVVRANPHSDQPYRLALLPGSRGAELARMLPVFKTAVAELAKAIPLQVVLPAVPRFYDQLQAEVQSWPVPVEVHKGLDLEHRLKLYASCHGALATSGTVALELALMATPAVIGYRVSPFLWVLRFVVKADYISLPNLILHRPLLPELLQDQANGIALARQLLGQLTDEDVRADAQQGFADLRVAMSLKQNRRPARAAAEAVLDLL